jgi:hypothetical protein
MTIVKRTKGRRISLGSLLAMAMTQAICLR